MRRPIIPGLKERDSSSTSLQRLITSRLELMERLRKMRTRDYLQLFSELDVHSQAELQVDSIIKEIEQEFSDIPTSEQLIGIIAKCYLDKEYDVHLLDRDQTILKHIRKTEKLPANFEKARALALHPGYLLIEVYEDCLRAVSKSGEISVVKE